MAYNLNKAKDTVDNIVDVLDAAKPLADGLSAGGKGKGKGKGGYTLSGVPEQPSRSSPGRYREGPPDADYSGGVIEADAVIPPGSASPSSSYYDDVIEYATANPIKTAIGAVFAFFAGRAVYRRVV